jgi:hypothetical protein
MPTLETRDLAESLTLTMMKLAEKISD